MLQAGDTLHGFEVKSTEELPEIDGHAIVMDHPGSGAKLLYLKNDDENKSFSIGFKTPPADDTGVFHILEHSVLCGSEKFPVKEPFVNLLRTSMQTFLNAMTFPDKTVYPVASTNEQDLINLMDVYMDAVLHPSLYTDKHIFEQEGWHFELAGDEASGPQLVYNGVVFNEMKGALSEPEDVMLHAMNRALFPDTCYAYESGGHPRSVPQLTYENFCETHARHYNLANSYIVLYGDMDIDRILGFLDENYLGAQARQAGASSDGALTAPNPIGEVRPLLSFDNVVEMSTSPDNAMVGIGYVVGAAHDFERVLAVDILLDALMGGNESPLKRAVLDAQIGGDCTAFLIDAQTAPAAFFLLKNAKPGVAAQFRELIEAEVAKLVEGGIPRDVLEASLAQMSFSLRERDRGIADGVVLAINALSGWLYSDDDATTYLHFEKPLATLRAGLENRYFEQVLGSLVLDTRHAALVDLQVVPSAEESEEEAELAERLSAMTEADLAAIEEDVAALRERQEAPDAPEALASLPQLHVSDIGPAKEEAAIVKRMDAPLPCLFHPLQTRRIAYLTLYFNCAHLDWEDMPYLTVLAMLLGKLDTPRSTAAELDVELRTHLGNLRFYCDSNVSFDDPHKLSLSFAVGASALSEELESLATLPMEVALDTRFTDKARIKDKLVQKRISLEESFLAEGHLRAMSRATSYLFESGVLTEALVGVDFYHFLKDLIEHFDERFDGLAERLDDLRKRIFAPENCIASFTGSEEDLERFWDVWREKSPSMCARNQAASGDGGEAELAPFLEWDVEQQLAIPAPSVKREAFTTPTDVCYVAKAANLGQIDYDGRWQVLGRVMGYDYLWNEVRVKGGAYGCGFRSSSSGLARFYSYRDPQLEATLARFDEAGKWLADFAPDSDEMEGYIVASVATHDAPMKPRLVARRQDAAFLAGKPANYREQMRESLLAVTPEQLRELAPKLDELSESEAVCVFGNASIADAASTELDAVTLMEH